MTFTDALTEMTLPGLRKAFFTHRSAMCLWFEWMKRFMGLHRQPSPHRSRF